MGRLRANFARLGNPMQDCHLRKEPTLRDSLPALLVILSDSEEWSVDQLKEMPSYGQAKGQFLVDSRILCRMRAVHAAYKTNDIKYKSAGRLLYVFPGFLCDESHFGELAASGGFSPPARAVCLFSIGQSPVVKFFFILRLQGATKTL